MKIFLSLCLSVLSVTVSANEVAIRGVQFNQANGLWTVHVTLEHEDSGWDHYADAWRVVNEKGDVLGNRILYHPHENEQPFTRSLGNVLVPKGVSIVFVEAHDKVHGWSKQRVRVDLSQAKGERFEVRR